MDLSVLFEDKCIKVRQLQDCTHDYNLLTKWLSDVEVCEFYEGKTKIYSYNMVLKKFEKRAKSVEPVVVGIIEYDSREIGFVQYYETLPGECEETDVIDREKYKIAYGLDIIIGDKDYWNKGVGSKTIQLINNYLFEKKNADIIFIAPQMWNKRAIRCYEKAGFKQLKIIKDMEYRDDKLQDGVLLSITK